MKDAAKGIIGHYERHARSWDADRRARGWSDKPYIERFLSHLPQGASVLDLGCGGGDPVALYIAAQGFRVTGVDSSPTLLSLAQSRMPEREWIVGDMRSLALGRRFDGILAWDSFFHLSYDDQRAMFDVFAAHAAKGAILMFNAGRSRGVSIGAVSTRYGLSRKPRSRGIRSAANRRRLRITRTYGRRVCQGRSELLAGTKALAGSRFKPAETVLPLAAFQIFSVGRRGQ